MIPYQQIYLSILSVKMWNTSLRMVFIKQIKTNRDTFSLYGETELKMENRKKKKRKCLDKRSYLTRMT
jgi:hypothetical protein